MSLLNNIILVRGPYLKALCSAQFSSKSTLKNFEDIPTPPGGWLPFLGHFPLFGKAPHGPKRAWKNILELKNKYVPPEGGLLKFRLPFLNKDGNGYVVQVFDPNDSQDVYRQEGKYPNRGSMLTGFLLLRQRRPDMFGETTGVLLENGERWHNLRSKVQQDLMRPKSAMFYVEKVNQIGDEFTQYLRKMRNPKDQVIDDFLPISHRFGLESITLIALDTHLGCFKENITPELARYLVAVDMTVKKFPDLMYSIPVWDFYLPPRINPTFRVLEDNAKIVIDFVKEKIDEAILRFNQKPADDSAETSVLEKMILRNGPNSAGTHVMAFDMVIAGIDTTGNTLAFLMYHLSRHPEKQEKLRQEIKSFGRENLKPEDLGQMRYFRACLQESFRLTPTAPIMGRLMQEDAVIHGYHIPAGTMVMWFHKIIGGDPKLFENPEEFRPERWIDNKESIHPFAVRNFSHGPRMCIGKRFAEMELQIAAAKLLQNFRIEWAADYEIDPVFEMFNVPDKPLKLRFIDL